MSCGASNRTNGVEFKVYLVEIGELISAAGSHKSCVMQSTCRPGTTGSPCSMESDANLLTATTGCREEAREEDTGEDLPAD